MNFNLSVDDGVSAELAADVSLFHAVLASGIRRNGTFLSAAMFDERSLWFNQSESNVVGAEISVTKIWFSVSYVKHLE